MAVYLKNHRRRRHRLLCKYCSYHQSILLHQHCFRSLSDVLVHFDIEMDRQNLLEFFRHFLLVFVVDVKRCHHNVYVIYVYFYYGKTP